jgi:hypothetical protein
LLNVDCNVDNVSVRDESEAEREEEMDEADGREVGYIEEDETEVKVGRETLEVEEGENEDDSGGGDGEAGL